MCRACVGRRAFKEDKFEHYGDLKCLKLGGERAFFNHVVAEQLIESSNPSICRPCIFRFAYVVRYVSCQKHSCAYTMPIRRLTHIVRVIDAFRLGSYKTRVLLRNACFIAKTHV